MVVHIQSGHFGGTAVGRSEVRGQPGQLSQGSLSNRISEQQHILKMATNEEKRG